MSDGLLEAQTAVLSRLVEAVEAPHRERRRERLQAEAAASSPPLFGLFRGERALRRALSMWGGQFAALWTVTVPSEYLSAVCDCQTRREWPLVRCVCGSATVLEDCEPLGCTGGCGRFFLALPGSVRVYCPEAAA